jgi:hypothetical protein
VLAVSEATRATAPLGEVGSRHERLPSIISEAHAADQKRIGLLGLPTRTGCKLYAVLVRVSQFARPSSIDGLTAQGGCVQAVCPARELAAALSRVDHFAPMGQSRTLVRRGSRRRRAGELHPLTTGRGRRSRLDVADGLRRGGEMRRAASTSPCPFMPPPHGPPDIRVRRSRALAFPICSQPNQSTYLAFMRTLSGKTSR